MEEVKRDSLGTGSLGTGGSNENALPIFDSPVEDEETDDDAEDDTDDVADDSSLVDDD